MRELKRREVTANFLSLALTLGAAFFFLALLIFLLSGEPRRALQYLFIGPFSNPYYFGNWINASVPLILTGLGAAVAFQASLFNLGGEGQVYVGGLSVYLLSLVIAPGAGVFALPLLIGGAALAGAAVAGLSGFFKMRWRTDELISSFLISSALILIVDQLITGPFKDPHTNLMATPVLPRGLSLGRIFPPSSLNGSLFIALALAVLLFFYLYRTHQGYETRLCGVNREFARYGGIPVNRYFLLPLLYSGALHGLAGALAVTGTYGKVLKGFSAGMGWNGIAVALIARNHPLWVIPAALFFAFLESGAKIAMIHTDITLEVSTVAQAVVFFLITSRWIREYFLYGTGRQT